MEEQLQIHSDTIKRFEETQLMLKSVSKFFSRTKLKLKQIFQQQIAESQEKQLNFQKLVDENRKLDSNVC